MGKVSTNQMVKLSDYISPADAATLLGCTNGRIYQLLRANTFRDLLPVGKKAVLIPRKQVERLREPAKTGRPRKNLSA